MTFTTEAGYISKDGTTPWITNGALYYTTDGTAPSGLLGVAATNSTTTAVALTYDHESDNNSIAGQLDVLGSNRQPADLYDDQL